LRISSGRRVRTMMTDRIRKKMIRTRTGRIRKMIRTRTDRIRKKIRTKMDRCTTKRLLMGRMTRTRTAMGWSKKTPRTEIRSQKRWMRFPGRILLRMRVLVRRRLLRTPEQR